ncbi:MAG: ABC transporter substrate-binding protein [Armatimonadetes bacterium]|nr:ABC transporter substrate-binding protein [Armatimonadota bacterium]
MGKLRTRMPASRMLLAFLTVIALAVTVYAPAAMTGPREKVLKMSWYSDIVTLDPIKIVTNPDWPTVLSIYNGLVRYVPGKADLEPDLATRWTLSPDGLTYTFSLRKGVKFHKGFGEFTAEDVKFSYERAADRRAGSRFAPQVQIIKQIEIVDPYTVKFHMKEPYVDFLHAVAAFRPGLIISKRGFEAVGAEKIGYNPIGTGAYMLESYQKGEKLIFRANPDYFRGKPRIDRVEVQIIPEEMVSVLAMRRGQIHYTYLRTSEALRMAQMADLQVTATPVYGSKLMWMNIRKKPFDNVLIRRALAYAINRKELVNTVMKGQATTEKMWSAIPPGVFGHTDDVPKYDYNPERAKQLLREAGYPNGIDFAVQFRKADRPAMEAVHSYWNAVGARAKLEEMEHAAMSALEATDDWTVVLTGPTRVAPDQFLAYYHSTSQPKYYGLIDNTIEAQRREVNPDKRKQLLGQIQKKINEDVPSFPIYRALYVTVTRSEVTGDVPNTHFWLWYWEVMDIKS